MKSKSEYNKKDYLSELVSLWVDVCAKVYLIKWKEIDFAIENIFREEAERAWEGTNFSPLEYVVRYADPKNVTNQIIRGQKAREQRWDEWLKNIQSPDPDWMTPQMKLLSIHNDSCLQCRKATRGRFAGLSPREMSKRRCEEGRKLFEAMLSTSKGHEYDRSIYMAEIASEIVEANLGEKEHPEGFFHGRGKVNDNPVRWTKIKCSQCESQVYFDLIMFRHRCSKCSYGF